jgi:hypothetical protein
VLLSPVHPDDPKIKTIINNILVLNQEAIFPPWGEIKRGVFSRLKGKIG